MKEKNNSGKEILQLLQENYDIKSSENKNANVKSSIQYSVNNSENLGMVAEESEKYKYE